jgi:hypothetical protein
VTDRAAAGLDQRAPGLFQQVRVLAVREGDRPGPPGRGDDLGQAGVPAANPGLDKNTLMLVCPSAARAATSASSASPGR